MKVNSILSVIQNISNYLKSTFRYIYQTQKKYPTIEEVEKFEKIMTCLVKIDKTEQFCELEIYRLLLTIDFSEEVIPAEIILYYQADSGLFWSDFTPFRRRGNVFGRERNFMRETYLPKSSAFIYLSSSRIARFLIDGHGFGIRESMMRHQSIEEACQRVIFIVEHNLMEIKQQNDYKWYSFICLEDYHIDDNFFYPKKDEFEVADQSGVGKVVNVTECDGLWQIELEGYCHQTAKLIVRNKRANQEEPVLLTDDFYKNRKFSNPSKAYCLSKGLPLPEYDHEVLEVWVNGVKKEIL